MSRCLHLASNLARYPLAMPWSPSELNAPTVASKRSASVFFLRPKLAFFYALFGGLCQMPGGVCQMPVNRALKAESSPSALRSTTRHHPQPAASSEPSASANFGAASPSPRSAPLSAACAVRPRQDSMATPREISGEEAQVRTRFFWA
jgi:hypothetical protein